VLYCTNSFVESFCHVGVHEGGFGRYISVLVCYIPAKYQSWIQHQDHGGYVQKSDTTPTLESDVYIYIYTIQVLFKCTSNSSVALNIQRWQTGGIFSEKQRVGIAQINGCVLKRFTVGIPCSLSQ